jgi:hypothetical protein
VLRRAGKRYQSITLDAGSKHLLADVWTSVAVVAGGPWQSDRLVPRSVRGARDRDAHR